MEKITVHYTPSIYLEANRFHYKNRPQYWFYKIYFGLGFCFFGLVFLVYAVGGEFNFFTFIFLILCLISITYEWTILPTQSNSLYKKQKMFADSVELLFGQDFIEEKTCISETKIKYIYQYKFKNNLLLIYLTPVTFIIVPKKFCTDEEQFNRIIEIVANLPSG